MTGGPDPGAYTMDDTTPEPADYQMNQYTTTPFNGLASVSRTHDLNGNVTLLPFQDDELSTTVIATATYGYRNLMTRYQRPGMTAEYAYDALGRRIGKTLTEDEGSTPTVTTTLFFYRGDQVIEERDGTGGVAPASAPVAATYIYGNGIDEVLTMRRTLPGAGSPSDFFYHSDDQGTIWAVTDAAGDVVERYNYEDYGETLVLDPAGGGRTESAIGNPYRYTGRRADAESELYWYRTRYYDSLVGRFVSRDSIGVWGDSGNLGNAQAYCRISPHTLTDPLGKLPRGERGLYRNDDAFWRWLEKLKKEEGRRLNYTIEEQRTLRKVWESKPLSERLKYARTPRRGSRWRMRTIIPIIPIELLYPMPPCWVDTPEEYDAWRKSWN